MLLLLSQNISAIPIGLTAEQWTKKNTQNIDKVSSYLDPKRISWTAALQTDQKGKASFCHSVRVASALKGPITTICTANAYIS